MSRSEDVVVLRCLVFPRQNTGRSGYLAQCIDLDLTVWRPTVDGAIRHLTEQIQGYIETIQSEEDFDMLVPRRSPIFPDQIRYYTIALLHALPRIWKYFSSSIFNRSISRNEVIEGVGA